MRALFLASFGAAMAAGACTPHAAVVREDGDAGEALLLPYPADASAIAWDGWAGAFVTDYCVQCHSPSAPCGGSGCHPSAGDIPDFRQKAQVVALAPMIQCGVAVAQDPSWTCTGVSPKDFPVDEGDNPLPTDPQRALVVDWIEAGCP